MIRLVVLDYVAVARDALPRKSLISHLRREVAWSSEIPFFVESLAEPHAAGRETLSSQRSRRLLLLFSSVERAARSLQMYLVEKLGALQSGIGLDGTLEAVVAEVMTLVV